MKKVSFDHEGNTYSGFAEKINGKLWLHVQGKTYTYAPKEEAFSGSGGEGAGDPFKIAAPMPGKIIKVLVPQGADVKAGDVLVVMEAMKMEYKLKASCDAKVSEIHCSDGKQVTVGETLVSLKGSDNE